MAEVCLDEKGFKLLTIFKIMKEEKKEEKKKKDEVFNEEEEEKLKERLKALGYL